MKCIFKLFSKVIFSPWFISFMLLIILFQMLNNGGNPLIKYELQQVSENYYQIKVFGTYIDIGGTIERFFKEMTGVGMSPQEWMKWLDSCGDMFDGIITGIGQHTTSIEFNSFWDIIDIVKNIGVAIFGGVMFIVDILGVTMAVIGRLIMTVIFTLYGVLMTIFNPVTVSLT